jgi:hypothetical protein
LNIFQNPVGFKKYFFTLEKTVKPQIKPPAAILKDAEQAVFIFQNHNPAGPWDFKKPQYKNSRFLFGGRKDHTTFQKQLQAFFDFFYFFQNRFQYPKGY